MLRVRDLMSRDVVAIGPDVTLRDAIGLLDDRHIGGVPVVRADKVVGVVSAADILGFQAATPGVPSERDEQQEWELEEPEEWEEGTEAPGAYFTDMWTDAGVDAMGRLEQVKGAEWDVLEQHTVAEAMTRAVCSIRADALVSEAAKYLVEAGIHRLLVLEGGRPVGIITTTDIVRGVADRGL